MHRVPTRDIPRESWWTGVLQLPARIIRGPVWCICMRVVPTQLVFQRWDEHLLGQHRLLQHGLQPHGILHVQSGRALAGYLGRDWSAHCICVLAHVPGVGGVRGQLVQRVFNWQQHAIFHAALIQASK